MKRLSQKGVAAVEMTILLPFMLLLIFATAELGRFLYQYNTLTKLVRDAGVYLAAHADTRQTSNLPFPFIDAECGNCIAETKNLLIYGTTNTGTTPRLNGLSGNDITITEAPAGSRRLVISVSYNWQPLFGEKLVSLGIGNDVDLSFNLNTHFAVTAL
ncbi:pilus assembly protein TadE [Shewanella sp. 10N.286.52.C2]|uniref:TadE/TadG family type IV pilus assembly protein n=1 Tax=unclassified Shewanella TaxID=196818 RepID=UPI000C83B62D|nr:MULTISPECIES: TadE family protein [unclassified Shewanella]MDO6678121.1 pilus assembly protein [Shewanella sp. 4_MG-2023]PMG30349.1 pilus assembly protein TadE [Shewanella sp. 10N.286.52.C2]